MKKNIAIVYGGDSGEFEVSVNSGNVVLKHLDPDLFNGYLVLMRHGQWTCKDHSGEEYPVNKDDFTVDTKSGRLSFDAVFNAIHGSPGEDGKLQGYLEMLDIPVTSCDQATSALTFNKFFCNRFVSSLGVKVAPSFIVSVKDHGKVRDQMQDFRLPVFVKPNRGGSSVGTTKVRDSGALEEALDLAFREDDQVIIEEFIPGREITCGVLIWKGKILALPLTEIVSKKEFFDYEAKYLGMSDEITPAHIPEETANSCKFVSVMLYQKLNCRGMVRCDYIFNDQGLFFLEVNTVPGLSEASIVPQQAREQGISLQELFTEVILDSLTRK